MSTSARVPTTGLLWQSRLQPYSLGLPFWVTWVLASRKLLGGIEERDHFWPPYAFRL